MREELGLVVTPIEGTEEIGMFLFWTTGMPSLEEVARLGDKADYSKTKHYTALPWQEIGLFDVQDHAWVRLPKAVWEHAIEHYEKCKVLRQHREEDSPPCPSTSPA